jgi:hypothetical protein
MTKLTKIMSDDEEDDMINGAEPLLNINEKLQKQSMTR